MALQRRERRDLLLVGFVVGVHEAVVGVFALRAVLADGRLVAPHEVDVSGDFGHGPHRAGEDGRRLGALPLREEALAGTVGAGQAGVERGEGPLGDDHGLSGHAGALADEVAHEARIRAGPIDGHAPVEIGHRVDVHRNGVAEAPALLPHHGIGGGQAGEAAAEDQVVRVGLADRGRGGLEVLARAKPHELALEFGGGGGSRPCVAVLGEKRLQRLPGGVAGGLLRGGVEEAACGRRLELALVAPPGEFVVDVPAERPGIVAVVGADGLRAVAAVVGPERMEDVGEARAGPAVAGQQIELVAIAGEVLADVHDVRVGKAAPQQDCGGRREEVEAPRTDAREGVGGPVLQRRILARHGAGVGGVAEGGAVVAVVVHHADAGEEEAPAVGIDEPPLAPLVARGGVEPRVRRFAPVLARRRPLAAGRPHVGELAQHPVALEGGAAGGDVAGPEAVAATEKPRPGLGVEDFALRAVLVEREPEAVGAPPLPRGAAALVDFKRQRRLDLRHAADFGEAEAPDAAVVFREKQVPVAAGAFDNRNGRVAVAGNLAPGCEVGLDHEIRGGREFPRDLEGRRLLVQNLVSTVGGELAAERIELLPRGALHGQGRGGREDGGRAPKGRKRSGHGGDKGSGEIHPTSARRARTDGSACA